MKKILALLFILLVCQNVTGADYQTIVLPDTNKVDLNFISSNDTLYLSLTNLSQSQISEFFLTSYSHDSMTIIETVVDGNPSSTISTELLDGTIYPTLMGTRFLIGSFTQSISLTLYSPNSSDSHLSFSGNQPFAFFGIAEPMLENCCVGIRGNIDSDLQDIIDITDLVYLVDFMFTQGPSPICVDEANVDGDALSIVDITDLVLLVDFMFTSENGNFPADCP